ncbi:MAG: UbiA prenyltransferase family protein [Candidatus Thorarchaeota archaeon]|jgi:4-hydroxybenzoate polyprenyltransferase
MAAKDYIRLMRPWQWYKNLLVFIAVIFVEIPQQWPWENIPAIFDWTNYPLLILGFVALSFVSSAGYIINDISDMEKDSAHPEKKNRPLPSGGASKGMAYILATALMLIGIWLSYYGVGILGAYYRVGAVGGLFLLVVIFYIVNAQLYNYFLRRWAMVDVVILAVGFILRAIGGTFLIGVPFTSWLVVGIFFFALILGFGKRKNELQLLGEGAEAHKEVFDQYTDKMLDQGIAMSATWFVLFYALYVYNNFPDPVTQPVMMTVPIAAGLILRYVYLIQSGSPVGRKPHLAFKDLGILVGSIIFLGALIFAMFFWQPVFEFIQVIFPLPEALP